MLNETERIIRRLMAADREHQKEVGGCFFWRRTTWVWFFLTGAFLLDLVFHLASGPRAGLILLGLLGFAALAGTAFWTAFIRQNRPEHTARILEDRDPSLGSRLINLLQLRGQARDDSLTPLTRELAGRAVEHYAAQLKSTRFERAARTASLRLELRRAWIHLGAFILLLVLFHPITRVEVARFLDPYGDHPPYSFTRLEILEPGPDTPPVVFGRSALVKVKVAGHRPRDLFLTAHPAGDPAQSFTLPLLDKGDLGYVQQLENVRHELILQAHTKDHRSMSRQARLDVLLTPQLEGAFVEIRPPAYTGIKAEEKAYRFQPVQALAGSDIRFRLQSNRPLREGTLEVTRIDTAPVQLTLERTADREVSGLLRAEHSGRLQFRFLDAEGIPSVEAWEGALTVTRDLPPEVRVVEPPGDSLVAMDYQLDSLVEASDDYGLRSLRVHRALNDVFSAPRRLEYPETGVRLSRETVNFTIADLGVEPGDVLSLYAEAVDAAPTPHLSRSDVLRLRVISVDDYNRLMREQTSLAQLEAKYAELLRDWQALIEEQAALRDEAAAAAEALAQADPDTRPDRQRQMDELLQRQEALNQKIDAHAERLDQFVRDNPLYDVEENFRQALQQQARQLRESTALNRQSMQPLAQPSPSGPAALEAFRDAAEEQLARLTAGAQQAEQQIAHTLQEMLQLQELVLDFQEFQQLYEAQRDLAAQAAAYNRTEPLSREDQLALQQLAATENEIAERLALLENELRQHAAAAEELFPKAAGSGRDLADAMQRLRLEPLARQTTETMLAGQGDRSFRLADRLRSEMEKLFRDCQGGNCPNAGELDAYLTLQRGFQPGNTFDQMSQARRFGPPGAGVGYGFGLGQGSGPSGTAGYAVPLGQTLNLLGNEKLPESAQFARSSPRKAKAQELPGRPPREDGAVESDAAKEVNPVQRESGPVTAESALDEYRDVVDGYFKALSAPARSP